MSMERQSEEEAVEQADAEEAEEADRWGFCLCNSGWGAIQGVARALEEEQPAEQEPVVAGWR